MLDAGVLDGRGGLIAAIVAGLMIGKPVGLMFGSYLAVKAGLATKPAQYGWGQILGAGFLGGIGFTMSLFIANLALPSVADFNAAKIAIFVASGASAAVGMAILWWMSRGSSEGA